MQTKAGETTSKCVSWKQDATPKEIIEEIIGSTHSDATPLDMSKDNVNSLQYYQEETHDEILEFIHAVKQRKNDAIFSLAVTQLIKCLEQAIKITNIISSYF